MYSVLFISLVFPCASAAALRHTAEVAPRGLIDPPSVIVTTLDGREIDGVLISWTPAGGIALRTADGSRAMVRANELDLVRIADSQQRASAATWEVRLVDGSRFGAVIDGADDENVLFQIDGVGLIRRPIDAIRSVTRVGPASMPTAVAKSKNGDELVADEVQLRNGDKAYGILTVVDAEGVSITGDDGETEERFAWDAVMALTCGASLPRIDRNQSGNWLVRLDDGAELVCDSIELDGRSIKLGLRDRVEMSVLAKRVLAIERVRHDRIWLSEIPPATYHSIPFFNVSWPLGIDQNAVGGTLKICGREYARGLGFHSACRVTWRVPVDCRRLSGWVGIDDSASSAADAEFVVRAGKRVLAKETGLHHGERPRRVDVELVQDVDITIEVGFGRFGDVHDRVNFVNSSLKP